MYIFSDSGSTKTDWIIADNNFVTITNFKTIGLNPYFVTYEIIIQILSESFPANIAPKEIEVVFFYGSGCGNEDKYEHLKIALQKFFYNAKVNIFSDMLGAARATLQHEMGIAAIIGTGTNSCLYNGDNIVKNAISLGYILGDEGSGAYIGKIFIKKYLEKEFDYELSHLILEETSADHTNILSNVYSGRHPNRYLASFCPFIKKHINHPQLYEIVKFAFEEFFQKYILIYPDYFKYKIGFVGSIAINFKDILIEVAKNYNITNNCFFCSDSLNDIIKYHKSAIKKI